MPKYSNDLGKIEINDNVIYVKTTFYIALSKRNLMIDLHPRQK